MALSFGGNLAGYSLPGPIFSEHGMAIGGGGILDHPHVLRQADHGSDIGKPLMTLSQVANESFNWGRIQRQQGQVSEDLSLRSIIRKLPELPDVDAPGVQSHPAIELLTGQEGWELFPESPKEPEH
jgi:hypothetical protein